VQNDSPVLLIIEDDADLRAGLTFTFRQEGYAVRTASTLDAAGKLLGTESPDLIILDVMLPDGTGFDLIEEIRTGGRAGQAPFAASVSVPVIFLTARDEEIDIIQGLELGGDDYITKPFRLRELVSRVKARLRRPGRYREKAEVSRDSGSEGLLINTRRGEVRKDGRVVPLTASEYRILLALSENAGQVLNRDQLADRLLGMADAAVDANTVSVYIRRLREKIEDDPSAPEYIVTVRGLGYRYEGPG
jgi:DNA-binding response OmpR family regulator